MKPYPVLAARAAACTLALCLAAGPAVAQMDPASFKEHPVVKHYPGALIDSHDEKEFDAIDMVVGYKAAPKPAVVRKEVEGRVYKTFYIHQGGVSALPVMRNYETALKAARKELKVVKAKGHPVSYWQETEKGWVKQG